MGRAAAWIAIGLFACADVPQQFSCATDAQCNADAQAGWCEPTGDCSFSDAACTQSGRRYAHYSDAARADSCVIPTPDLAARCGLVGLPCCRPKNLCISSQCVQGSCAL